MTGLPTVRVDDILVHPRDNDLILGTHGRSIWIIDDITPLQQMTDAITAADASCSPPRPAVAWRNDITQGDHGRRQQALPRREPAAGHGHQLLPQGGGGRRREDHDHRRRPAASSVRSDRHEGRRA